MLHNRRLLNLLGFAACVSMLVFAELVQKLMHLEPCPLCVFQRVGIALVGVVFLLAALVNPRGSLGARIWGALIALATLAPIGVASRHIWVQAQPEGTVPSCGATLDYMLEVFPLLRVFGAHHADVGAHIFADTCHIRDLDERPYAAA
jgi:disulfide bond formation protein DsbB